MRRQKWYILLAKWKRLTLAEYGIEPGYGIYTDMNAIRADERAGATYILYMQTNGIGSALSPNKTVNIDFLKEIVTRIYAAMVRTEYMVYEMYPQIKPPACHRNYTLSMRKSSGRCIPI